MTKNKELKKKLERSKLISAIVFGLIVVAYAFLTFTTELKPEDNVYNLSNQTIRLLQATILVPVVAIWFAAWQGAFSVRWYAKSIANKKEAAAWHYVAVGLLIVTIAIISNTFIGLAESTELLTQRQRVILSNATTTWLTLIAFVVVAQGAKLLLKNIKSDYKPAPNLWVSLLVTLVASGVFVAAVYNNDSRTMPVGDAEAATYYLTDVQIFWFAVVPTVVTWIIGIVAANFFFDYAKEVKGILYKLALKRIVYGLVSVVSFSILIQLVVQLGYLINLGLSALLAAIYVILALYAVGYVLIYSGAKKLRKIEEV